jgi:peptidoglycan/LPS O-acetylase OafA/YrhL
MLYARNAAAGTLRAAVRSPAAARAIAYRPDIDGLRAISVLAVILFHARVPGFAGGYVGVDVFFVISGYLITQILVAHTEHGVTRRLRDFYVRRCRRILPALLVMLVATAPLACWLFPPGDLASFGRQLAATAVFLGNLAMLRGTGYFDLQTPLDPLAHLWSIGVEEQFYVVFPLVLIASGKSSGRRIAILCGAAVASFALCVWGSYAHPTPNFFLAPTRAWELLLGSLVALGVGRSLRHHRLANAFAAAALVALAACLIAYDRSTPYPGLYALVPCASAAILLATGGGSPSRVSRWLGARPLVFTGLISYSLYLWHVPVLGLAKYYHIRPFEPQELALVLCSIYLLAALSWRYVEAPIRGRAVLRSDARFLAVAGAATVAIASLGALLWGSGGLPGRLDATEAKLVATDDRYFQDAHDCVRSPRDVAAGSLCSFGPQASARAQVVVWGDSHAITLFPAYEQIASARGVRVRAAVHPACRPLLGVASPLDKPIRRQQCAEFNRAALAAIDAIDPALVILNAYWMYPDLRLETSEDASSAPTSFAAAFERTLRELGSKRKICVVGDVPKLDYDSPSGALLVAARRRGLDPTFLAPSRSDALLRLRELDGYFADLGERHGFAFVDPTATLCAESKCALLTPDGRPVYRDDNHLAVGGALLLAKPLEACFDGIP